MQAICDYVHDRLEFGYHHASSFRTAWDGHNEGRGVCRDFAHIGTAFCRALGIPARFVSCYAHGLVPSDFHAVFEAYLDGRWWLFDATRQADLDGLVRIGVGRDAAEIAFSTPYVVQAQADRSVISASKAALQAMVLGLSKEVGPRGITANVVIPGATDTGGFRDAVPDEAVPAIVGTTPLDRFWCPTSRKSALSDYSGTGPDYIGIRVQLTHASITGLLRTGRVLVGENVYRVEAQL